MSSLFFCKISFIHYTSNIHFTFYNHNQQVNLFTIYCHKWRKVSWIKNNLSDFNKIAKQLMDDWNQKKHFSSKFQILCSNPILAQYFPNSAQVLSWTYWLIIHWLQWSNQLKESVYWLLSYKTYSTQRCGIKSKMWRIQIENYVSLFQSQLTLNNE